MCENCPSGRTECEGDCFDFSVCPVAEFPRCHGRQDCLCTRIADNNNSPFCAQATTCDVPCGPDNSCPQGQACVVTCCEGPGNAGLRCLPSCPA